MPAPRRPRNFRRRRPRRKKQAVATKKDLMNLRSQLVETKSREQFQDSSGDTDNSETILLSASTPGTAFINTMTYDWKQGVRDWEVTGDEITLKYLTQKLRFSFPVASDSIVKPYRLKVVWGFITRPQGFTEFDTIPAHEISRQHYINHATKLITYPWNDKDDHINFRQKQKTLYKVIGSKWVRPNRNNMIGMPASANASSGSLDGSVPDVNMTIHWPVKGQKWRLTYSDDSNDPVTPESPKPFRYVNEAHIPFTVVYAPECDNVQGGEYATDSARVRVTHNCKVWFTDS